MSWVLELRESAGESAGLGREKFTKLCFEFDEEANMA